MVPTDLHYTQGSRVGPRRRRPGHDRHHRPTPPTSWATSCSSSCPAPGRALEQFATFGVVESVKAVSDLFAPVSGEVVEVNGGLGGQPRAGQQRPVRRRLDDQGPPGRPGPARRPARRGRLRRAHRGRLTHRMPYGPHTADDRERMLAALGLTSVDELFEDIPAELRASPARPARQPEPELELARPAQRAGRPQPDRPGLVPRGRRLPPLEPARGRPAPPPRRVVHGLHAVPAGDQPGHAPEHLRVRVAAGRAGRPRRRLGVALRRGGGHGGGRADDLPGDPPRARPRLARRPPALPRDHRGPTSRAT